MTLEPDTEGAKPRKPRKPRSPNHGGWRGNPNSLAALDKARGPTQTGGPRARTCAHCNRLAVRGAKVCRQHGGWRELVRQGRERPSQRINRQIGQDERRGLIPDALRVHPAWIAVRKRGAKAALLALELRDAFTAGGQAWTEALRLAKQAGFLP